MTSDAAPLPGYPEPYDLLASILQDATFDWRNELWVDDLEPEVVTWRPRPDGQSIGAIILHMIITEVYWLECFVLDHIVSAEDKERLMWNEIDVDNDKWPEPPYQPLSWYFALHDEYRARTLESIKRWPGADELITVGDRHATPRWVLGHVIQHETYHGGQIVMLHDLWKHPVDA